MVDSSALVAILRGEPERDEFMGRISRDPDVRVPASCYVETAMVMSSAPDSRMRLDEFLASAGAAILGSDARQARLAADAFDRYGRGSGHAARLNFGDCLAYAASAAHRAPLLFKGDDFAHTDVIQAS